MNQRKRHHSLWLEGAETSRYPALEDALHADVVVIGGGITGLSTAYRLQKTGLKVLLLEAGTICSGVTGYTTAKITALHSLVYKETAESYDMDVARHYAEANMAGVEQVAEWVDELSIDCECTRCPAYTYTTDADRVEDIKMEVEVASQIGLPAEFTVDTELPFPVKGAIRVPQQLRLDPYQYCLGLARGFSEAGGQIFEQSRATEVNRDRRVWQVKTPNGRVTASHVVMATLIPFLDRGGFFARAIPERSYLIAVQLSTSLSMHGMYINADHPTRSLRQAREGAYLLVGGEHHKTGQEPNPEQRYENLKSWARENFPVEAIPYTWSAQDYTPVDGLPYIGQMPFGGEHLWVATGFKKWGLSWGTAAAMIIGDQIVGRSNPWTTTFDPKRINLAQSAKRMLVAGADAFKRFFGDRIRHNIRVPSVESIDVGEGGVCEHNGKSVGAYRDEDGVLHIVSLVCPHMGCHVTWNKAEKSWDCPCHGSRFSGEGRLLQGPAVRDLEPG